VRRIASVRLQPPIRVFAGADARRRGADDDCHARAAVTLASGRDRSVEVIREQAAPGEPVVAAIPLRERRRQRLLLETGDTADPGRERRCAEIVALQAAATLA